MLQSPSVLIVNGRALVRATLAAWLRTHGFASVVETGSPDATSEACRLSPGVVLLNVVASDPHAPEAARSIHARYPDIPMLALVDPSCEHAISNLLAGTTSSLFSTNEPPERLVGAILAVAAGGVYQSPGLKGADRGSEEHCSPTLTPREIEVLRYLAHGQTKKQIAETIHLSIKTIDNHCTSIMAKLNIHNRVELARYAIREGLAQA